MKDTVNSPVKWLRYLLYVGIAVVGNTVLNIFLPDIAGWLNPVVSLAALYMISRLVPSNGRYLRVVLFSGAAVLINILNIRQVALAGSVCALLGQYQEYQAHGELVHAWDQKLAEKWSRLFWLQFGVEVIMVLAMGLITGVLVAGTGTDMMMMASVITVVVTVFSVALKILYLLYLKRSIRLLETEAVE